MLFAMAHPGEIVRIEHLVVAPGPINMATAAVCAAALEIELPLWTDLHWQSRACHWLQYDCMSSIVSEPCTAKYAVVTAPLSMPALDQFRMGDADGPEQHLIAGADQYQLMVEHFADVVMGNTDLMYPPADSIGNMRVLDALAQAARTGETIKL